MNHSFKRVRTALIGAGNFAQQQHLPNLARMPEADFVLLCDRDAEKARNLATRYGVADWVSHAESVWKREDIDAVVIAVRDDLQPGLAVEALRAGKHVYVEKPLGGSTSSIEPILLAESEAAGKGIRLAVGFNKRFAPIYRKAREVIGRKGAPRNMHLRMTDDAWRWARGYAPGHLLRMDVCHFFDLLRWLSGSEIARIACLSARAEDDALLVGMADGSVATINFSGNASMDMPKERFDAVLDRGGISAEDYVELRTFGYPDLEPAYHFAGHALAEGLNLHRPLMEKLGFEGWLAIRRSIWEIRLGMEADSIENAEEAKSVVHAASGSDVPGVACKAERPFAQIVPNFLRDQGWFESLRLFLDAIREGTALPGHAGARDAWAAAMASEAAEESRRTGRMVSLSVS